MALIRRDFSTFEGVVFEGVENDEDVIDNVDGEMNVVY